MKIIHNGLKKKKLVRCKACKSIIRVSLEECAKYSYIDYSGYFKCECPVCESRIKVKSFKEC